jgi:small subunit ribosomal protein S15
MYLDSTKKKELFEKYGKSAADTGSAESQIALFTVRIAHLTEHLKANHKDYSTERALKMLVGKRRRLLDYLISKDTVLSSKNLVSENKKLLRRKLQKGNSHKGCPFFLSVNYMVK